MTDEPIYVLLLDQAAMLSVPGYFVLQTLLARRWSGGWPIKKDSTWWPM